MSTITVNKTAAQSKTITEKYVSDFATRLGTLNPREVRALIPSLYSSIIQAGTSFENATARDTLSSLFRKYGYVFAKLDSVPILSKPISASSNRILAEPPVLELHVTVEAQSTCHSEAIYVSDLALPSDVTAKIRSLPYAVDFNGQKVFSDSVGAHHELMLQMLLDAHRSNLRQYSELISQLPQGGGVLLGDLVSSMWHEMGKHMGRSKPNQETIQETVFTGLNIYENNCGKETIEKMAWALAIRDIYAIDGKNLAELVEWGIMCRNLGASLKNLASTLHEITTASAGGSHGLKLVGFRSGGSHGGGYY